MTLGTIADRGSNPILGGHSYAAIALYLFTARVGGVVFDSPEVIPADVMKV